MEKQQHKMGSSWPGHLFYLLLSVHPSVRPFVLLRPSCFDCPCGSVSAAAAAWRSQETSR